MSSKQHLIFLLSLAICIILTHSLSLEHGFTYLDDQVQVVNNSDIQHLDGKSLRSIFSSTSVGMYQPVTTLFYAMIYQLNGLNPIGYHLASILFHLLNSILLFNVLKKLGFKDWLLVFLTSIFALHPMQVESIAWVSAFSNLVFTSFYLLSLLYYLNYLNSANKRDYFLVTLFFLLSCFSKATAISLPLILVLLDLLKGKKAELKLLYNKIPLILISLIFAIVTINSREAAGHLSDLSISFGYFDRIFLLSYSILFYPFKFLWGFQLSAFYPYPELTDGLLPLKFYGALVLLITCIWLIFKFREKRMLWIGALIYFLIIAPTLHFIPVGNQLVTDRYIYLPMLGLLLILGTFAKDLPMNNLKYLSLIMIIGLGLMSFERSKVWENDQLIWEDVLSKHPKVAQAYNNLGSYVLLKGEKNLAFQYFDKAVKLKPYYADAYNNRGNLYSQAGESEKAISDFNKAIELRPHADAYFNRANELSNRGNFKLAIEDYNKSIELMPSPDAYTNRAFAKLNLNKDAEAVADLNKAIQLKFDYHQAYFLLAMEARKRVNFEEACNYLQKASQYGNKKAAAGYKELCRNI